MTKVSGSLPTIEAKKRSDLYTDIAAKICIDGSGRVTSVDVMRAHPELKDAVASALKTWRYKPYLDGGAAVPVCFASTMKVKKAGE